MLSLPYPQAESAAEVCSLIGCIRNVKYHPGKKKYDSENPPMFRIRSAETNKDYDVACPFFCPARAGDAISGFCLVLKSGQLRFIRDPVVEPASSEEEIKRAFFIALAKTKPSQRLVDKLYKFFHQETIKRIDDCMGKIKRQEDPVYRNRDSISTAVLELISNYAYRFFFDETTMEPLINAGITRSQAETFLRWWYRSHTLRRLYLLGLTTTEIIKCTDRGLGPGDLYYRLLENPYTVVSVPLEKAQKIALKYGLQFDSKVLECGKIVRLVDKMMEEHKWTCYPISRLTEANGFSNFTEYTETLIHTFKCSIRYKFLYLDHSAECEDILTEFLRITGPIVDDSFISQSTRDRLYPEQLTAVKMALTNPVSIITGGGGTGKTTVISAIVDELKLRGATYLIASFTGKAVVRLKEVIHDSNDVKTLHMILMSGNIDKIQYLIVDEVSMVPNNLLARVLLRMEGANIILVGDPNQVQPIECGDLFNQLLKAQSIPTVKLLEDHRRANKGTLFTNTHKIITQDRLGTKDFLWGDDCLLVDGGKEQVESLIKSFATQGLNPDKLVIISPYNRDLDHFNQLCCSAFLPESAPQITDTDSHTWKLGSRVMLTKNRYDIMVMNGEEGKITGISPVEACITVTFHNGKVIKFPTYYLQSPNDQREGGEDEDKSGPLSTRLLTLSWAVTVHKSQGSEWNTVIFSMFDMSAGNFVNKNLTYTGISRAQERLYIVADSANAFFTALNTKPPTRFDNLSKRLQNIDFEHK